MTEEEWLTSDNPEAMVRCLESLGALSKRKMRLFGVACCRQVWAAVLRDDRCRRAVEAAELFADDPRNPDALSRVSGEADDTSDEAELDAGIGAMFGKSNGLDPARSIANAACYVSSPSLTISLVLAVMRATATAMPTAASPVSRSRPIRRVTRATGSATPTTPTPRIETNQHFLLRDIFGNPFRPVAFDPAWRSDTVVSLARHIYDSRDFSPMPILADALQDAGCGNADILNHCRDENQVHVRGCWTVDLVLDKA
jgi:hypothetical protein